MSYGLSQRSCIGRARPGPGPWPSLLSARCWATSRGGGDICRLSQADNMRNISTKEEVIQGRVVLQALTRSWRIKHILDEEIIFGME